jgi:hypothetical protein
VDGDGLDDLLIGALGNDDGGAGSGMAALVLGASLGADRSIDLADADYTFFGDEGDYAGYVVSGAGDVDGDGLDDILIAAHHYTHGEPEGKVYLVLGASLGSDGLIYLSDADYAFIGQDSGDGAGYAISSAGDVDGDGLDDILIGSPYADDAGTESGKAHLVLGASLGADAEIDLADADYIFLGEAQEDSAGYPVSGAGDVDGDGLDDILIGADHNDDGEANAGKVYLVLGASLGADVEIDLAAADYAFLGEISGDVTPSSLSAAGDVDGDGLDDILIGAFKSDDGGSSSGKAYLVLGSSLGTDAVIGLADADAAFLGEGSGDYVGHSVSTAGDVNGDGLDDLLIGAYGNGDGGYMAGKVYLLFSPRLCESAP